mgnify:CR=1 FL=1
MQHQTGMREAVITGVGKIQGHPCVLAVMDSNFFMGSMSAAVGEKSHVPLNWPPKESAGYHLLYQRWSAYAGRDSFAGANG